MQKKIIEERAIEYNTVYSFIIDKELKNEFKYVIAVLVNSFKKHSIK